MSLKSTETPHCPRCGHAAFQAESVPASGKMWHKICFRCGKKVLTDFLIDFFEMYSGLCKKMLELTTVAEHDGDIYCKQCYTRKFGIRGVGFGIGAGALGMDTGDRFGNSQSQLYVYFLFN
jgi:cysteine/glycine-rich protein